MARVHQEGDKVTREPSMAEGFDMQHDDDWDTVCVPRIGRCRVGL
jgi:hypothetical protein